MKRRLLVLGKKSLHAITKNKATTDASCAVKLATHRSYSSISQKRLRLGVVLGAVGIAALSSYVYLSSRDVFADSGKESEKSESTAITIQNSGPGEYREGLKDYTRDEVSKHTTPESRIWVTYKEGVYDITDFIEGHPGGEKILLARGNAIDPYWRMYAQHKNEKVYAMLEEYRIGNLAKTEAPLKVTNENDPYANEPERLPVFEVRSQTPFNAEPPLQLLIDKFITPNELFFVRNHLPVPVIDKEKYRLKIAGEGLKETEFTLEELKSKFKHHTVVATIQCAGNRRSELHSVRPVKGLFWGNGAISTGEFKGVLLRDILQYCGYDVNNGEAKHVHFEGLDTDPERTPYAASIPMSKATNKDAEVIIAFEMNGEELPRDHGFPIRAIVPGVVGARNVKWIGRIITSKQECQGFWQQKDYKGFSPATDFNTVDYNTAPAIQELPVQSAICSPLDGTTVEADTEVPIKGYAWSGGGRGIIRVDVITQLQQSAKRDWDVAKLSKEVPQESGKHWAWTRFEHNLKVPKNAEKVKVCTRAVDEAYNVQPENAEDIWNFRGLLSNAWSCIHLNVKPEDNEEEEEKSQDKQDA